MQLTPYSAPDFDPYGDRAPDAGEPGPWIAPTASAPLSARVPLPGSKSLTNRELVLATLADAPSLLRRPLHSRDTRLMVDALRSLGARIDDVPGDGAFGPDLLVTPPVEFEGSTSIECGLAGTVMRFIPPIATLGLGPIVLDGDPAARERPMRTTIDALRALGVDIDDAGRGALPFTIHASGGVDGGEVAIDASASSQFVSGLLLAAPRFRRGLTLRHTGEHLPSLPHIEMTIAALAARGVAVANPEPGVWIVEPGAIAARDVLIEPDLSNAAPFLLAPLLAGGTVTVPDWPADTTQPGDAVVHLVTALGAKVTRTDAGLTVDGGTGLRGGASVPAQDLDLADASELACVAAAALLFADGPSTIGGIAHTRGHETDRLAAICGDVADIGGWATELPDGVRIEPHPLHDGPWRAFGDHRMAHAGAVIGLAVEGIAIDDISSTAKTMPEFPDLWARMLSGRTTTA